MVWSILYSRSKEMSVKIGSEDIDIDVTQTKGLYVRIPLGLHRDMSVSAAGSCITIQAFVARAIERYLEMRNDAADVKLVVDDYKKEVSE
jgi:hypothetical protein